jgi:hypothetical protein
VTQWRDDEEKDSVHDVRCLECGTVYSKPLGGGTVDRNPGCPACGYVGWLAVTFSVSEGVGRSRSVADHRPPRSA